ncbi:MAG: hypothetical protein RL367_215, partial [Pseudomonadota bacterium]
MADETLLGPWIRRFLLDYIVEERNLALNTQRGYRDAFCQLIPFIAKQARKQIDHLAIIDVTPADVRAFLTNIETSRCCGIATRNQRLAAFRAFAGFMGKNSPIHIAWSGLIRSIPFKKASQASVPYLERPE